MYATLYLLRISICAALLVGLLCVVVGGPPTRIIDVASRAAFGGALCWVDGKTPCDTPPPQSPRCGGTLCTGSGQNAVCPPNTDAYHQPNTEFANAYQSSTKDGKLGQSSGDEIFCWSQVHCRNGCRTEDGVGLVCKSPSSDTDYFGNNSKAVPTTPSGGACTQGGGG